MKIFVYGTLRNGYGNHRLIVGEQLVGNATTIQKYHMTASGIPFVAHTPKTSHIFGEIYEVSEEKIPSLDHLEGHPCWYKREAVPVRLDNGETTEAWLYFNDKQAGSQIIETGNYDDYSYL